jgi:hypothetical protein
VSFSSGYIRPTLTSLFAEISELVQDKNTADSLKAKVDEAQNANLNDQMKILIDLQKEFHSMGPFVEGTLGRDATTLLENAQLHQVAGPQQSESSKP